MLDSFPSSPLGLAVRLESGLSELLFLLDDDPWRDHQHQAVCIASDGDVAEQTADVRNLAEHRHTAFGASFAHPLDSTEQNRSTVRHTHRRADLGECEGRQLDGRTGDDVFFIVGRNRVFFVDHTIAVGVLSDTTAFACRSRPFEREGVDVTDLAEEWYQRQSDEPFVVADDSLDIQLGALVEDHDHGLLCDGKVTDNGRDTGNEWPLALVRNRCDLTIKQRDLRSLHHVRPLVALCGLQEEERFDVAQDCETDRREGSGVRCTEGRYDSEGSVVELNVQVRRRQARDARQYVLEHFDRDRLAEKMLQVLIFSWYPLNISYPWSGRPPQSGMISRDHTRLG